METLLRHAHTVDDVTSSAPSVSVGIIEDAVGEGEGDRDSARGGEGVIVSGKSPSTVPCAECFDHPCVNMHVYVCV